MVPSQGFFLHNAPMTLAETIDELRSLSCESSAKTYRNHGATGEVLGVKYADLYKIQKRIKRDHALAHQLWNTDISDARALAPLIADPDAWNVEMVGIWLERVDNYGLGLALAAAVAKSPRHLEFFRTWKDDPREWHSQLAWSILAHNGETAALSDAEIRDLVDQVEREIHTRPNRTRYSMLGAMIAFGLRASVREAVLAAADRIGDVEVTHATKGCRTPGIREDLEKALAHREKRKK
jgi:3-methyladenine DNA glycosylase AlkD